MRLSQIYPFLSHLSLTPRQVAGYNRMISQGTAYADRLTAQERAVLIRLLREEEMLAGMAHVITEKLAAPPSGADSQPRRAGKEPAGLPSLLFAVLAPDWAGLADACLGTVHEAGLNIAYTHGFILRRGRQKLGAVLMEVEIPPSLGRKALDIARAKIQERLSRIAAEDEAKRTLQKQEARRLYAFTSVTDILRVRVSAEDLKEMMGDSGEALKFFVARQESYLNQRSPESIADQIQSNYQLKKRIRQGHSALELAVYRIPSRGNELTGLSVITSHPTVTLERILRRLEEAAPGFRRHHDYAYFTADRISVFHLEVTDRDDRPLAEADIQAIRQALASLPDVQESLGPTPGVELIRRKIVPPMLDEERDLKIPQGYIHPHAPDHFKIVIVASGPDAGFGIEVVRALSREPGFSAAKPDMPSYVRHTQDGQEHRQEISIIDLWVDRRLLFGPDQGRWSDEDIYNRVESLVRTVPGFGPKLRIFDRTSRTLRQMRLQAVSRLAESQGLDLKDLKPFFYTLGDQCLLNPKVPDTVVLSHLSLGCRAKSGAAPPHSAAVVWENLRLSEDGPESTVMAVALPCRPEPVSAVLGALGGLQVNSVCRSDLDRVAVLLLNLTEGCRPLSPERARNLAGRLEKAATSSG
ncbi:MAG TPA: hypothetical protein DDW31_01915 [candidate division Zixibacteria bacterium]|jgi:hypothetical protein|nr:hypothetical protein [candidate division Zixibacteria bacterium]